MLPAFCTRPRPCLFLIGQPHLIYLKLCLCPVSLHSSSRPSAHNLEWVSFKPFGLIQPSTQPLTYNPRPSWATPGPLHTTYYVSLLNRLTSFNHPMQLLISTPHPTSATPGPLHTHWSVFLLKRVTLFYQPEQCLISAPHLSTAALGPLRTT